MRARWLRRVLFVLVLGGCTKDWDALEREAASSSQDGSIAAPGGDGGDGPGGAAGGGADSDPSEPRDGGGSGSGGSGGSSGSSGAGGSGGDAGEDAGAGDACPEGGCVSPTCSDGVKDDNEECDDGEDNSDTEPNACRTNCTVAHCGDGVVDTDEDCDAGDMNSDSEPNSCRTSCDLPSCGDSVTDRGEECDDDNDDWGDSCFECSRRHYFILNSPSALSAGDDSIVRVDRRGHSEVIVGPDNTLNGMREIELSRDGSVLYALQSHYGLMQHRVIFFDPQTGALRDQVAIDMAALGYNGSPSLMTLGLNDLLYVLVHDNTNTLIKLITVNPATKAITPLMNLGAAVQTLDMTRDDTGSLFFATGSEIRQIVPAFSSVNPLTTTSVVGLTYVESTDTLWGSTSSSPLTIERFSMNGDEAPYAILDASVVGGGRGLLIEPDGTPLLLLTSPAKVVAVAASGSTTDVWTEDLHQPSDIKVIELQ